MSKIRDLIAKRNKEAAIKVSLYEGFDVLVLPVGINTLAEASRLANVEAAQKMADSKAFLSTEPIDEQAWKESFEALSPLQRKQVKKPANKFEQERTALGERLLMKHLAPQIVAEQDGSIIGEDILYILYDEIDLLTAIGTQVKRLGNQLAARNGRKKSLNGSKK